MCNVMFVVVESFFCVVSQNNEPTAECGAGRRAEAPEASPAFKCKQLHRTL